MTPRVESQVPRGWRSLRRRIPLFTALPVLVITVISAWAASVIITRHGEELERERAHQAIQAFDLVIDDQGERLAGTLTDYAQWDAANAFLVGANPTFTTSDLTEASLERLGLAALVMIDRQGLVRLDWSHDDSGQAMAMPKELRPTGALRRILEEAIHQPCSGLAWYDDGPALFVTAPVRNSKGNGAISGVMAFISRLDQIRLGRLARQIEASGITAHRLDGPSPEIVALTQEHLLVKHSRSLLEGGGLSFACTFPRRYAKEVSWMTFAIAGGIALSGLVSAIMVGWLIDRLVLRRITALAHCATVWGQGGSSDPEPAGIRRPDEIGMLVRSISATCEHLVLARSQADESNRAKNLFLATMSHDIRTPLNGMLGMTELLLRSNLDRQQQERLTVIRKSGLGLLALLNSILDLSKIEAGSLELVSAPCSPGALVQEVVELLRASAAPGVSVTTVIDPALPHQVLADEVRLLQILYTLVGNAVKFTRRDEVRIAISSTPAPIIGYHDISIEVQDHGPGIAQDEIGRLFQPYQQGATGRQTGGTGLGLVNSQRLANLMGGIITVTSLTGLGSTFTLHLRLLAVVPSEAIRRLVTMPTIAEAPVKSDALHLRILVAEDDLVNQSVFLDMLDYLGAEVTMVGTGTEAVEHTRTQTFDLVLMDYHMPEMDGLTATRLIRQREAQDSGHHHLPIVALTADALKEDQNALLAAGMDAVLTKPIQMDTLAELLSHYKREDFTV